MKSKTNRTFLFQSDSRDELILCIIITWPSLCSPSNRKKSINQSINQLINHQSIINQWILNQGRAAGYKKNRWLILRTNSGFWISPLICWWAHRFVGINVKSGLSLECEAVDETRHNIRSVAVCRLLLKESSPAERWTIIVPQLNEQQQKLIYMTDRFGGLPSQLCL